MPNPVRAVLVAVGFAVAVAACGSSNGSDPDASGRRNQAVEELRRFGLSTSEAGCMADELGPDVVVEAPDVATLADGRPYQDAAERCIDDG